MFDYSNAAAPVADETDMQRVARLVELQKQRQDEVDEAEAALNAAKGRLKDISENELPVLMVELGLATLKTTSGLTVELQEKIRASIPKAREQEAFDWLEENGNGGLIKRQFIIAFGKDEDSWADKFERDCAQRKKQLHLERKKSIHSSTLGAFVKRELAENGSFPEELFGVFRQRTTKID